MSDESILRLLIVENSGNAAQVYIRTLRNARFALRSEIAEDDEDLVAAVTTQEFDLVLSIDDCEGLPLAELFRLLAEHAPDLPVIVAAAEFDSDTVLRALRHGACNVIDREAGEQLQRVVAREADNVRRLRRVRELERRLTESEKRCLDLLGSSRDAIAYVHEGMHIYANPSYLDIFGHLDQEAVEGVPLMDMVSLDQQEQLKEFLRAFARGDEATTRLELTGLRPDGQQFPALMEFSPASYDGEPCTQIIIRDETESIELEKKLHNMSRQDAVTGLYNSPYFVEALDNWLHDPTDETAAGTLTYITIDDFKSVRESVGLAVVDHLLRALAELLDDFAGEDDLLARFGDKSFALFTPGRDMTESEAQAEQVRAKIEETLFEIEKRAVSLTCSFGISPVERGEQTAQDYLARADMACDTALAEGGNRLHRHNPVSYARATQQRDELMVAMIDEAKEFGRFRLHYQPIVSLMGSTDENYEVFLRMLDEKGEYVPPNQFIPAAERSGQIAELERWVVANAVQILAKRHKAGKNTTLFINVSGASFDDSVLIDRLREMLSGESPPPASLVFEVCEHDVVEHIAEARRFSQGLAEIGCRIALDHFGSTANSYNCLKQIHTDYIKLDRALITGLKGKGDGVQAVQEVVDKAHDMKKQVIAEFIENADMLSTLWQCRIDHIQGFFLQEPSAAMSFDFEGESI